jgi:hypothetical protein
MVDDRTDHIRYQHRHLDLLRTYLVEVTRLVVIKKASADSCTRLS